jgi:AraC-like DNA-binding protein
MGELQMISVGHVKPNPDWRLPAHFHHFHEMVVIFGGQIHVNIDGQSLTGRTGDILFYPKGVRHAETSDPHDPVETYFVSFDDDDLILPLEPLARSHDQDGRIRMLISWLHADRNLCAQTEHQTPPVFLSAILAELQRLKAGVENQLLATVRQYIQEHMERPLTLSDLAALAGMSKYHFLRRYKALSGRTPIQDLTAIRIDHARKLILTTNLPLKTIAPMSGLGSEYHLSRLFRKHLGLPPGQLRKTAG